MSPDPATVDQVQESKRDAVGWAAGLSDVVLAHLFDEGTLERARVYAEVAVGGITVGDGGSVVLAEVQGTRPRPYQVLVTVSGDVTDLELSTRCSCPVARHCKHIAAVLLRLRSENAPEQPALPPWRELLDSVAAQDDRAEERAERQRAAPAPDLVVLVEIDEVRYGWGRAPVTMVRLRGSRIGKTGRAVRNLSWSAVIEGKGYNAYAGRARQPMVREEHAALAEELLALDGRGRYHYRSYGSADAVDLGDLGAKGWDWVRRAMDAGVSFVEVPGQESVRVDPDPVALVASLTGADEGGVELEVRVDGRDEAGAVVTLAGDPVSMAVLHADGSRLVRPLGQTPADLLALVGVGPIRVEADDVADLLATYLPVLRRHTRLESPDGAVDLSALPWTRLVARVHSPEHTRLEVEWGFEQVSPPARRGGDEQVAAVVPVPVVLRPEQRERLAEVEALTELPGHQSGQSVRLPTRSTFDGADAVTVGEIVLPLLEDDPGVRVERLGTLPLYREAEDDAVVHVSIDETEGTDWFDLSVEVSIDGEQVPLVNLLDALSRGEGVMLLPSGTWFRLDRPELAQLRDLLEEAQDLRDPESGALRVSRYHVGYFDELVELGVVERQAKGWARQVERLRSVQIDPAPPLPDQLSATLRPYQLDGYQWLSALWDAGLGGILADDMGLGKTIQVLATLSRAQERGDLDGPVLVVAPTSVVGTWVAEAARFAPRLRVVARPRTTAKSAEPIADVLDRADVVVTTYAVARIDAEAFAEHRWRALVLDEAHTVKNHQSKTYRAVRALPREVTLAVTGTPVENSLMDLWALLSLVAPGLYPRPDRFSTQWRRPIERGDGERLAVLHRRVRPLMLRRTKDEVAIDLPPKTVQLLEVVLDPAHRRTYDRQLQRERQRMLGLLRDPEANRVAILASLTRLRQLALDPRLISDTEGAGAAGGQPGRDSAKIDVLVDHLRELAGEGHRALVFSQFTSFLGLVRARLEREQIGYSYLDGSTTARQRVVEDFRTGDDPVFLISLKAGGTGLTLTEADYVFVLDPWWNPAAETQAIDRAHRIGQDKPVMVYRMVAADTIEDKVVALQDRKRDLVARVVDDDPLTAGVTAEDLASLLDPGSA
ncbi:DEAD/DEAH box helicase [Marihabitans asiaticum]